MSGAKPFSRTSWAAVITVFAFTGSPSTGVAQDEPVRTVDLEMYLDLESVSDPQIAPDGSEIVYTRGWVDKMNDRRESSIWIMNADGSKNRFLVDGSGPIWSPDGTRIAYTATGDPEGTQIFVRWMDDEGATSQVTRLESSPGGIRWSPNGEHLSFSMNVDAEPAFMVTPPGRPDGATWVESPRVVTRADYRQDRVGFVDGAWRHLFVVPAEGGTARQLTDGDWNHSTGEWTPDGAELVFSSLRTEDAELAWRQSEVYAVDVASGGVRQLTRRNGQDFAPLPSPRGDLIAYRGSDWHDDTYRNAGIYVMERDGGSPRLISGDFDRSINGMQWAENGSGLYLTVSSEGTRNLHFVSVSGGVKAISEGEHMFALS